MSGDPSRSAATDAACALLDELVARGLRHIVVSPGSRSQALALAAAELERQGRVRLHVRIDERVAGFLALGIGRETGTPAAVVCTSGTAVANLLPAVLEAHHAGVPLLLLTADRPPELRGVGANQTTTQPGIFGSAVRASIDVPVPRGDEGEDDAFRRVANGALDAAAGRAVGSWEPGGQRTPGRPVPGPAHLNLPFREPLAGELPAWFAKRESERVEAPAADRAVAPSGADMPSVASAGAAVGLGRDRSRRDTVTLPRGPRTVVVAGADAGSDAEELAHRGGWPLIAEVVSGARFGRNLVHGYREALRDPALGGAVERVAVLGHPTLARETAALLSRDGIEVIAARSGGEALNLNGRTTEAGRLDAEPGETDREWLGAWMRHSREHRVDLSSAAPDLDGLRSTDPRERSSAVDAELRAVRRPLDRALLVDAVWAATWPHDRLVFGSSRLVRVADDIVPGKRIPVHANRGLAGIDGTVATGMGVALAAQDAGATGVTRVLLGDLALLHDAGAMLQAPGEAAPRLQVIVGNDGGGTIFDGLEVARTAGAESMTRVQYTPHTADLAALAAAYGWEHARVTTRTALDQALLAPTTTPRIIEVPLAR
ncbi:2-succinyl-5-enolpyruvyl-6-hydroxy-3-cyclohexene-1-carboxylic-acid synthase [Microbacterium sp. Marseille-Q6965]|uniref:2-succinyl-5-enolpyruvyl-6-hydroxy-3- cyclohexene-1-carboxylic-acid synthase n=1 Tax=Microbacterium sp. Marseille-Q6965 TaxID=2965072 RepID=UPI0021B84A18|nr:2-succinyl-5-enolpyruvyl-6-hydroxy-3-cyclohexene-1-carboxylic-acid synthase [Microbacterium sp. Marseille-Q6965]